MKKLKVGDKVWLFDINRRIYPKDETISSSPIYSEHFYQSEIESETSRSWIVDGVKYSKKTLQGIYTDKMKEDKIWDKENRYKILENVRMCDIKKLKLINDILNKKEK